MPEYEKERSIPMGINRSLELLEQIRIAGCFPQAENIRR